ncbi:MAG: InlB B-repeat-containing protein [Candidatus Bathyarchaeia archaeon]
MVIKLKFGKLLLVFVFVALLYFGTVMQMIPLQVCGQYPARWRLTIQVNNQAGGTTSPGPGTIYVDNGLSVQVRAFPNPGYQFSGWYLNGVFQHKLDTITVTMLQDNVLMASFSVLSASLTITVDPPEGGVTDPPAGKMVFQYGSSVQVVAQANVGYTFSGWYLDGAFMGTDSRIIVLMSGDRQLRAFFSSLSPTPAPSPSPSASPTPTPPSLPPAEIDVAVESTSTYSGFSTKISGRLTANGVGLSNTGVILYLSVSGGSSWDVLSFVNTDADGRYSVVWRPSVTGNYMLNVSWSGNSEYSGASKVVNFAVTPYEEENVFSVVSNSTLSGLLFDSENDELRFSVTGPSGTVGYVNVIIPKTLVRDVSSLRVYLDGGQVTFESEPQADSWALHFTYTHSTHQVTISLSSASSKVNPILDILIYIISATAIVLITIIVIFLIMVRKKKAKIKQ